MEPAMRSDEHGEQGVRFEPGFTARLERLVARVALERDAREGAGRLHVAGGGEEFVGHRPYRPGEDLRDLDWTLLARLDRPFVRVRRREATQHWAIVLDASASMGVGQGNQAQGNQARSSKLQRAAEVATGLAFSGLRAGATSALFVAGEALEVARLRKRGDLAPWLGFLEGRRARGSRGADACFADPRLAHAQRVFVVGDQLGYEPRAVIALARRRREVAVVQLLAPRELAPAVDAGVEWFDPESGERLDLALDTATVAAYGRALDTRLETWRATCARHGVFHRCFSTAAAFEDVVRAVLA
jgi:uncharacterized protein (DUF58 family)